MKFSLLLFRFSKGLKERKIDLRTVRSSSRLPNRLRASVNAFALPGACGLDPLTRAIAVTSAAISSILKAVIQVDFATRSGFVTALRFDCQGPFSQLKIWAR